MLSSHSKANVPPEQTRPSSSLIDGVGIIAVLNKPSGPEIVLQKQFRPPIGKVVIEIPAGLVDVGEGAAESAVRELREETGYVGTVTEDVGVVMFNGEFWQLGKRSSNHRPLSTISGPFFKTEKSLTHVLLTPVSATQT